MVLGGVTLLVEILAGAGGAGESLVEAGVRGAEFLLVGTGALPVGGSGYSVYAHKVQVAIRRHVIKDRIGHSA